jgi:hypothetical protein
MFLFENAEKCPINGPKPSKMLPSAESLSPEDHLQVCIFILLAITYITADHMYLIAFEI